MYRKYLQVTLQLVTLDPREVAELKTNALFIKLVINFRIPTRSQGPEALSFSGKTARRC